MQILSVELDELLYKKINIYIHYEWSCYTVSCILLWWAYVEFFGFFFFFFLSLYLEELFCQSIYHSASVNIDILYSKVVSPVYPLISSMWEFHLIYSVMYNLYNICVIFKEYNFYNSPSYLIILFRNSILFLFRLDWSFDKFSNLLFN